MKLALIVNPYSGGNKGEKHLPFVEQCLTSHGIEYEILISRYHEHIIKIAAELDINRYDAVVGMGGDGTNFHVLNGLLSSNKPGMIPPIGILPVGSGNSFAMDLNILTLEDGIASIVNNQSKKVDVCSFSQNSKPIYFVNLSGFGFVTDVAKTARKFKFLKDLSYVIGVIYRTIFLNFHQMELDIDGKIFSEENCFVEFCNSRFTGGNMLMAPDARIDDGLMDIIVVGKLSRLSLLSALPKIYKGTHITHPAVRYIKARTAKIKTTPKKTMLPDGEVFGDTPTSVSVHPEMVRYLAC